MVPRTAVPSAIIASAVRLIPPCVRNSKYYSLILTRSIIGLLVALSLGKVHRRIKVLFGRSVAIFFMLITLSQPHFIFYASRPLPNIIVMPLGLFQITWGLTQIYASQMSYLNRKSSTVFSILPVIKSSFFIYSNLSLLHSDISIRTCSIIWFVFTLWDGHQRNWILQIGDQWNSRASGCSPMFSSIRFIFLGLLALA